METIVVASRDTEEVEQIRRALDGEYDIAALLATDELDGLLNDCRLLLLDSNFTENKGIDFLMEVASTTYLPVLMLTSPDDPRSAADALQAGAQNYIVKMDNYRELLGFSIKQAITRFNERTQMRKAIVALKARVVELEQRLGVERPPSPPGAVDEEPPPNNRKRELVDEIATRLRQGEINLPAYPEINVRFRQMLEQGAGIPEITDLLKKDLAISSKLISVSNSPYYRGVTGSKNLEQAISRLGLSATRNFVELISNRSLYTVANDKYCAYLEDLWKHSLACAYAAQAVSRLLALKVPEEVFSMGLLHDIGKLLLLQILSELEGKGGFAEKIDEAMLLESLAAHHGQFGASLLKKWRFSPEYSQVAKWHHNLQEADPLSKELLMVHLGNAVAAAMGYGRDEPEEIDLENLESAKLLQIPPDTIVRAKNGVKEIMEKAPLHFGK